MSWRGKYQEQLEQRKVPLELPDLPGWAKQALVAGFIFFLLLGASGAGQGLAADVTYLARQAVEDDLSWDEVKLWASGIPSVLGKIGSLDLRSFWSKAVIGKPKEMAWPVIGEVTSYFGWRPNPDSVGMDLHQGIDIAAAKGTVVGSVLDGVVSSVRQSAAYGTVVEIEHGGGLSSVYGHLDSVEVQEDQNVRQGDAVGTVGDGGNATGPHLHFELRKDGLQIDPLTILPALNP